MNENEQSQGRHSGSATPIEAIPAVPYPYGALDTTVDSLRLLKLKPGAYAEPVQCELIHTTFASKPKYEALSYTWGAPDVLETVDIDGHNVQIRENLYWALLNARDVDQPRLLWADAICINQDDLEERNRQVGLMAFIYSRAQVVLIWLGNPTKDGGIPRLNMGYPLDMVYRWLCARSYWRRVWIVQEIGLARKLRCYYQMGRETIVQDWAEFMNRLSTEVRDESAAMTWKLHQQRVGRHGDINQLEMLLTNFAEAQCAEPRDKIYGFLGLAHDCQDYTIKVDYAKSLFDLYVEVVMFQNHAKPLGDDLPPEIDRSMRIVGFSHLIQKMFAGRIEAEVAAYHKIHNAIPTFPSHTIMARGFIEGSIVHVGPSYSEIVSSYDASRRWRSSFERHYHTTSDLSSLRSLDEAYTSTILDMDETHLRKIRELLPEYQLFSRNVVVAAFPCHEYWLTGKSVANSDERTFHKTKRSDHFDRPSSSEPHRFLATNRTMGLCPTTALPGDLICRFWGTDDVAILLRWVWKDEIPILVRVPEIINSEIQRVSGCFNVLGLIDVATGWRQSENRPVIIKDADQWEGGGVVNVYFEVGTLMALTR